MLNQIEEVAAPHPPHILLNFFPLLPLYGDLDNDANFPKLAEDICDFVKANPVSWEVDDLHGSALAARCGQHSLIDLYSAIYEIYAERHNATIWCNKSMVNLYYIPQIESKGLKPIYIHLVRDGRDVAVSFRKAIVGEKHIYHLAKQWKQDQETAEKYAKEYAPDRYVVVYYEDLIHDAEGTMKKLLEKLNLNFNKEVLDFYRTEEAKNTAEAGKMWNNVVKPVMTQNSNKFLSQLSPADILLFESIAGDTLTHFGYKTMNETSARKTAFSESEIEEYGRLNKKMKEEIAATLDPEGSKKRQKQEAIIQRIKTGSK
jgi:hypothetical protein